jgi:hypothetical protein
MVLRIDHKLDDLENKYSDLPTIAQNLQATRGRLGERPH